MSKLDAMIQDVDVIEETFEAILQGEVEGREDDAWIDVHDTVTDVMVHAMADLDRFERGEVTKEQIVRAMWATINGMHAHILNAANGIRLAQEFATLPENINEHFEAILDCIETPR